MYLSQCKVLLGHVQGLTDASALSTFLPGTVHGGWASQGGGCLPGVALDALDVQPLVRVPDKDALYEVLALQADARVLGNPVVHTHDAVEDLLEAVPVLLILGALEGVLAEEHDVQHDPARPDVRLGAIIVRLC